MDKLGFLEDGNKKGRAGCAALGGWAGLDDSVDSEAAGDSRSVAVFAGCAVCVGFEHIGESAAFVGADGRDGPGAKVGVDEIEDVVESLDVAEHVESRGAVGIADVADVAVH